MGFTLGIADVVVIFDDGIRLEVGQVPQLRLAETMVAQAFHNAADLRRGSQGAMGGAQCAGSGRRGSAGEDLALVADLEPAVGMFEDLHLDVGVAGTLGAGQQLYFTVLSLATLRGCLRQRTWSRGRLSFHGR